MIEQLRGLVSTILIRWAFAIAPIGEGKHELAEFLVIWAPRQARRLIKGKMV